MINTRRFSSIKVITFLLVALFVVMQPSLSRAALMPLDITPNTKNDSLAAYWDFNEGDGSALTDRSGNKNNGVMVGAEWVEGVNGTALAFDGINDYVRVPDSNTLDVNSGLTIEAWINAASFFGEGGHSGNPIVCKWETGAIGQYHLTAYSGGNIAFRVADGSYSDTLTAYNVLEINVWHHIIASWDAHELKIFVDDELVTSKYTSITYLYSRDYTEDYLQIGHDTGGDSPYWYFHGIIDEVSIYGNALTESIPSSFSTELASPTEPRLSFLDILRMLIRHSIRIGIFLYIGSAAILVLFFWKKQSSNVKKS